MTSFLSNSSWNIDLIQPYNITTARIGPYLYQDTYRASNYGFISSRQFVEAAVRSSISRHRLNKTSLITLFVSDSERKIGASLPWAMTVADASNLYDMLLNNMQNYHVFVEHQEPANFITFSTQHLHHGFDPFEIDRLSFR